MKYESIYLLCVSIKRTGRTLSEVQRKKNPKNSKKRERAGAPALKRKNPRGASALARRRLKGKIQEARARWRAGA